MPLRIAPAGPAAWVPFHEDQPRQEATDLALRWLGEQQAGTRSRALLVTNDLWTLNLNPQLLAFSRRNSFATPRKQSAAPWGVPVLAFSPDLVTLGLAVQRAHGSPLCVVEGAVVDARGWAVSTAAEDLSARAGGAPPRADRAWLDVVEALVAHDEIHLADADRLLQLVEPLSALQRRQLPSALIARGLNPRTVVKLAAVLDGTRTR